MSGVEGMAILYVGTDTRFAADLETELGKRRENTAVKTADCEGALELLTHRNVDCLVTEYDLPERDCITFLTTVRERRAELPVVLVTDSGSERLASEAIAAGADGYVPSEKSDGVELLADRVETLLERYRGEASYREIFEKAGVALSVRDPETGAFVDANEQYCELMGYDPMEIPSLTGDDVSLEEPPYTVDRAHELFRTTVKEGPQTFEWVNERRDGTEIEIEVTLKPATVRGKTYVLASIQDITDRKRHERRLRELYRSTRELVRASTPEEVAEIAVRTAEDALELPLSGVHLDDGNGRLRGIAATDAVRDQFGGIPDYVRGEGNSAEVIWEVFDSGETLVIEDAQSHERLETEGTPTRSGVIHPLGENGVFITSSMESDDFNEADRVLAEMLAATATAALERVTQQRRYEAIFNQTFQLTGLVEPDGTLIEANDTALRFIGADREDVLGAPLWESPWFQYDDESRRIARESVERARTGEFFRDELTIVGADGTIIIDYSVQPVTDENGEVVLLVPEGRDITERKEREAELERKNQQLEEFASVVSHDLRNPLSVATGHLELASRECDSDSLDRVAEAHDRMAALIEDLLTLAREGDPVDIVETVDLEALARTAWTTVDTDEATLCIESTLTFEADRNRAIQLLENLFGNACEHGGTAPTVTIGVFHDGFYVADDGPGIDSEDCKRVFETGYSTNEDGTGFGLRIVERIATAHGWAVSITESGDGGARFEVTGVGPQERGTDE